MRNLKKVLSLVLVVAMLASMMIVGAAAADTEETKYPEAAAVISAIKVMEGDERGMRYGDTVTREEAAAIICRALLGEAAENLYTSTAPFADVAANRWSAKYISYLKAKGIVSGVSDTEFDPTANVTGIAFAKMLLTAVGYGKAGEFEGAQWDINTITFANQTGLYDGAKGVDVAADATREECMLYAFNTIVGIPAVNYNKNFEAYYVGSNPLSEPAIKTPYTLAATNFKLAKTAAAANEYGRPAATWTVDGIAVVDAVTSETPVATYTNGTTVGTIYAALGKAVVDHATVIYTTNGGTPTTLALTNVAPASYAAVGTLGDTVEVYSIYNGAGNYTVYIVVVSEKFSTVRTVNALTKTVALTDGTVIDGTAIDVTGLAKNDYVLYTKIGTTVKTVKEIAPVSLVYTANKAAVPGVSPATIVADGATYSMRITNTYTNALDFNKAYDIYFDSFGNVVGMAPTTTVVTSYDYMYVNRAQAQITAGDLINAANNKVVVSVAYPTGGVAVLDLEIFVNPTTYAKYIMVKGAPVYLNAQQLTGTETPNDTSDDTYETDDQVKARVEGNITAGWYTYTTGTNGGIVLGDINAASDYASVANVTVAINRANVGVDGKTASPATVLTTVDAYGNATVKTGYANFPTTATPYTNALITYAKGSNTITNIYVVNVAAPAPAPVLVYCAAVGNNIATGTEYTVVGVDGAVKTIVAPAGTMTAGRLYTITAAAGGTYTPVAYTTGVYGTPVNAGTFGDPFTGYAPAATVAVVGVDSFTDTAVFNEDGTVATAATPYYFDAYTVVVDCTGNGATTISEGAIFVATVNTSATNAYAGLKYCTTIWIVG